MNYTLSIIILVVIIILQFIAFIFYIKNLIILKNLLPINTNKLAVKSEGFVEIQTKHKNKVFDVIISSLNRYLDKNRGGVSDYHLMKDIIDRNCDSVEEEIQALIPIPIYLGLVGTMLGILVGAGLLVFSGGLHDLLSSATGSGSVGIEALLGGVALAMGSSIVGLILTVFGSLKLKNVKSKLEKRKNNFLSWIQAELLPNISNDTSSALVRMTQNLDKFNAVFSHNANNLENVLIEVTKSYDKQKETIEFINKLRITEIATANIDVYDKLKNSTDEIGIFGKYLLSVNEYLSNIQSLNKKLDDYEQRTQVIENAGRFYQKNEKWLAENIDNTNIEVQNAIKRFEDSTKEYLSELQESLNGQILSFDDVIRNQQDKLKENLSVTIEIVTDSFFKTQQSFENAISGQQAAYKNKLDEISKIVEEIKNLSHIKEGINDFKEATNYQNLKIDELTKEIINLAREQAQKNSSVKQIIRLPKWIKVLIIAGSSLFILSSLFYVIPLLIELITKLINLLF